MTYNEYTESRKNLITEANGLINEGKLDEALALQRSLVSLRDTFKYGNPNTMIKYATQLLGYPVGSCRAPFNSISGDGKEALRRVLDENREKGME